jgi:nucleoid-associated protein YgaU
VKDQVEINLEAMESRLTDLELLQASEEERWSSLRSDLEAVSETVAKQDVISRAKDSELEALHVEQQEALSHLQREVGEHHDAIDVNEVDFRTFKSSTQDELEKLKTMIKGDGEAMRDVRLGLSRVEEELKQQVGEREAGLRQELALAKQSSQSEQAVVKEEITDLKKRQDQVVNLRQDLEESRGENAELRKSLRELNSNVYDLQAQSQSQKKMMFTGIAAVLLLSVGLSTLMMPDPSLATMSGIPTQALSQSTAEPVEPTQSEDWIALDAPALNAPEPVVEAPVVEPAVAQQEADFSLDAPEVAPAVTSSFALQRTNESSTSAQEAEKVEYTVQEGDSLWKIAKEHRGQGGMMERIERIKRDNALDVDSLKPGQVLSIYL